MAEQPTLDLLVVEGDKPEDFVRACRRAWHDHLSRVARDLTARGLVLGSDEGRTLFRLEIASMVTGFTTPETLAAAARGYGATVPDGGTREDALFAIADAYLGWYA